MGKEKSKRSAAYRKDFCRAYGELAAKHSYNVAKSEFQKGRLRLLDQRINFLKKATAAVLQEAEDISTRRLQRWTSQQRQAPGTRQSGISPRERRTSPEFEARTRRLKGRMQAKEDRPKVELKPNINWV